MPKLTENFDKLKMSTDIRSSDHSPPKIHCRLQHFRVAENGKYFKWVAIKKSLRTPDLKACVMF
jgi:hypothetical protein